MAINSSSISSVSTTEEFTLCMEVVRVPPQIGVTIDPPVEPGLMIAYYNSGNQKVNLFVADELGRQWYKVG